MPASATTTTDVRKSSDAKQLLDSPSTFRDISAPVVVKTKPSASSSNNNTAATTRKTSVQTQRIKSNDYRSWDRFNVDKELELLDQPPSAGATPSPAALINSPVSSAASISIPANLTVKQRKTFAENEKVKGNDCMRAHEYSEAVDYYTKSLALYHTSTVLNNRALSYLKLEKYDACIDDCTTSLNMETSFKALLRRANAYYSVGKYQLAVMDVDQALELDDAVKLEATQLRKKIMDKWSDVDGTIINPSQQQQSASSTRPSGGAKKIQIEEAEEEDVEVIMTPGARKQGAVNAPVKAPAASAKTKKKVVIMDVDDDSDDEEN